ncbi:BMP family ABC transporter substrate-binding protein [Actinobacteria bacterium YIM 96077]|uniref:BMP family ABC transporter substrate-binding protein n=1 Tax=Phytoactinopolyspora halophila TaxID=1981511 RepID=A0A329QYG3_9ACTN|nr:BMP family ABC transporter substrate-binding protein [Phytoactinopolyspora halophila]AYY13399.1 BMP family ABC transporter substrate-binding protein [Actinobacteria bacterium YIM 96077]RAW17365.1 BMP family ABC transporter substrate-binding protein [Phytoactinopolyspora halophila]
MKRRFRFAAALGGLALVATACGEAPDEENDTATNGEEEGADFEACMVTDEGGVDDKSFNESAWNGLQNAVDAGVINEDPSLAESNSPSDFEPNLRSMVDQDCGLIVTVGFALADATQQFAEDNPDEQFAIVDFIYEEEIDNVKPLVFNTHEAAFLAGYVAAGYTETGTVGTWGGANIPTVTIFMDGFWDGVQHYNEVKDEDVEVVGWDKEEQDGQFVGDFSDTTLALQISENLIDAGADVLLPVAGPLGEQAAIAARDDGDSVVIWVDVDGYEAAPEYSDLMLTSVEKGISVAVEEAASAAAAGEFSNEPFVGTLENDGVGLSPYYDYEDELSDELKSEVEELREQIISGELTVESDAAF